MIGREHVPPGPGAAAASDYVDDIPRFRPALSVMRTVYEVAMVLGLRELIGAMYVVFSPITHGAGRALALEVDLALVIAVLLVAIRFFWITRNVSSYLRAKRDQVGSARGRAAVARRIVLVHFPIIICHALIFYFFSTSAAAAMAATNSHGDGVHRAYDLAAQAVAAGGALLLLNGAWLFLLSDSDPGGFWARNNLVAAGLIAILGGVRIVGLVGPELFTYLACTVIAVNSVWDLWASASFYILVDDESALKPDRKPWSLQQPNWPTGENAHSSSGE